MRRPENTIKQRPRGQQSRQLAWILVLAFALPFNGHAIADGERLSGFSAGDSVSIHAKHAWEDVAPETIHFSGQFVLKAHDWYLSADQATLYGNLDDPETAVLTGSPANIYLETVSNNGIETVMGKANRIVYQRATNSISLLGEASLSRGGQTMRGEQIEYNVGSDRIQAGGDQGISIRVEPED